MLTSWCALSSMAFCGTPIKEDCGEIGARCGGDKGRGSLYILPSLLACSRF